MRALLDTNIIIHRETMQATNYSIGKLYYWLDKLHCEKLLHPYTIAELRKADNVPQQQLYDARLSAYTRMQCVARRTDEFVSLLAEAPKTENDKIDNQFCMKCIADEQISLLQKIAGCAVKLTSLVLQTKFFRLTHLSVKPVQITLLWLSIKH